MATTADLLRRLADLEPSDLPILSIYLDMRPQDTGQNPGVRSGETVLKDRLREIEKSFWPRGDDYDSVQADAARIGTYLEQEFDPAAQGLALFACSGRELFEAVEVRVPFENQVAVGPLPDLFQLARVLDEHETSVVAVVDSNTARLFVARHGWFEEVGGPDDDPVHYRKRSMGGWSQTRYQRHIEKHRAEFAREAAEEIERLIDREGASRLILAGDEVAVTPLTEALTPQTLDRLVEVRRIHIRAPKDEIAEEIEPILARAEADDARSLGDQLFDGVRGSGLGVVGVHATREALDRGQVDLLILDPAAGIEEGERSDLIRLAVQTAADVEILDGYEPLQQAGGVGALLRYRL